MDSVACTAAAMCLLESIGIDCHFHTFAMDGAKALFGYLTTSHDHVYASIFATFLDSTMPVPVHCMACPDCGTIANPAALSACTTPNSGP